MDRACTHGSSLSKSFISCQPRWIRYRVQCMASVTNDGTSQRVVIERKAADVLVLGSSAVATAAAYSLSRQGKKVVLLPNLLPQASDVKKEALRPLHISSSDAIYVETAAEAAAYWRGLQNMSAASFFQDCGSLDLGLWRGQSAAASALSTIHDATKAAGVKVGLLRSDELAMRAGQLKTPAGCTALFQEAGGVLNSIAVDAALNSLVKSRGVLIRDRLLLRGWKDTGGYFSVRASSALLPDSESVFEAEQVLLAPDVADWERQWDLLFGLQTSLQIKRSVVARCPATLSVAKMPLWRFLGANFAIEQELEAEAVLGCWGFPLQLKAQRVKVSQAPGKGSVLDDDNKVQQSLEASNREIIQKLQQTCKSVLKGLEDAGPAAGSTSAHLSTDDGLPVLGWHPQYEEGRMLLASCTSGGAYGGIDGYQLSPLVAKAAADLLQGTPPMVPALDRWSSSREGVAFKAQPLVIDPWNELRRLREQRSADTEESMEDEDAVEAEVSTGKKYW